MLYCVLTESPEALNMVNEGHIKSVISLLEKVGRDPKVIFMRIFFRDEQEEQVLMKTFPGFGCSFFSLRR